MATRDNTTASNPDTSPNKLEKDIVALCDELSDFNENCAFFCDAFSGIAVNCEEISQPATRGIERNAYWLKSKANELKDRMQAINESYKAMRSAELAG